MSVTKFQKSWQNYRDQELTKVTPIITGLGFELDKEQVHIAGERYLSGGQKLVLTGRRKSDGQKVIIKVSGQTEGQSEINNEKKCRDILDKVNFAYHAFFSPTEILFTETSGQTILITKFIDQTKTFLERDIKEQFFLALKAFEMQEGLQATTYEHNRDIAKVFGIWDADDYINKFDKYRQTLDKNDLFEQAGKFLEDNKDIINLYSDFLTHWDLVPHNLRVSGHDIYLLDHSSLRLGNKYESWARFINFMSLHNPALEKLLINYVRDNRPASEYVSLRLMRVFRLIELIWHYSSTLDKADPVLKDLNQKRIVFWTEILRATLADRQIEASIITEYQKNRDRLRSNEENERQKKLH
jgi:hypothetical protein